MTHVLGTATVQLLAIATAQEDYLVARGTAIFAGGELEIEAYGKTAEALFANQNSEIVALVKIFGGSNQPLLKIERIMNASAPVVEANDERIEQVRKTLILKSKDTRDQMREKVAQAMAILEN